MVGFARLGSHRAAGEGAAAVAQDERSANSRSDQTAGGADVQDLRAAAENRRNQLGVAAQTAQIARGKGIVGADESGTGGLVVQLLVVELHQHARTT